MKKTFIYANGKLVGQSHTSYRGWNKNHIPHRKSLIHNGRKL